MFSLLSGIVRVVMLSGVVVNRTFTFCEQNVTIIGASLSERHTSESNGGFFIYYKYIIYLPYVRRSVNAS